VILDGLPSVSYTRLRARYRPTGRCLRQGSGSTTRTPHQIQLSCDIRWFIERQLHTPACSLSPYRALSPPRLRLNHSDTSPN
jgi:hypothetical protein